MLVTKANSGNALIAGSVALATSTTGASLLEIISQNSTVVGLGISAVGIIGGMIIGAFFKYKNYVETKRHNRRLEELTAQLNDRRDE